MSVAHGLHFFALAISPGAIDGNCPARQTLYRRLQTCLAWRCETPSSSGSEKPGDHVKVDAGSLIARNLAQSRWERIEFVGPQGVAGAAG